MTMRIETPDSPAQPSQTRDEHTFPHVATPGLHTPAGQGNPLRINVLGTPAPQGSKRGFYNKGLGRVQMVESSTKVKPWRQDVTAAAQAAIHETQGFEPFTGPVAVAVIFFLPRPQAHWRTGRHAGVLKDTAPAHVDKKPDVDKLLRATLDALTSSAVFRDDAQVAQLTGVKRYADAATGARITISALTADPVSVPAVDLPCAAGTAPTPGAGLEGEASRHRDTHQAEEALFT